ncbi:hypothetical protein ACFLQ1_00890 [Candidatus Auribacterota bacterium]
MYRKRKNKVLVLFGVSLTILIFGFFNILELKKRKHNYKKFYLLYKKEIQIEDKKYSQLKFTIVKNNLFEKNNEELIRKRFFFLIDDFGDVWLFKPSSQKHIIASVVGYRLFKLFGCKTPEAHQATILIKGKQIKGYMQRFILNTTNLTPRHIDSLSQKQIEAMLSHEILDWLFVSIDTDFIIQTNELKVTAVDKDNTLREKTFSFPVFYNYIWEKYLNWTLDIDLQNCLNRVIFIENFPNDFITEIIEPYVEQFFLLGPVYRYANGKKLLLKNKREFMCWLFDRKANLYPYFETRYKHFLEKRYRNYAKQKEKNFAFKLLENFPKVFDLFKLKWIIKVTKFIDIIIGNPNIK